MSRNLWFVLKCVAWSYVALYAVVTFTTWYVTLKVLGLSSIRLCPRILRLSLRAPAIREQSVILVLPMTAILLLFRYEIGVTYLEALPFNALLLVVLMSFSLFLVPPTALVFSSSTDRQLRWALILKRLAGGRRVISLLDVGHMRLKLSARDALSFINRRSSTLTDVLRTSERGKWQEGVEELIGMAPIVIIDTRVCTQAILYEASMMLTPQYLHKAIFVSEDDRTSPVLEKLFNEGRVQPDHLVSIVKEDELEPLLKRLLKSRDSLPKPKHFVCTPIRINEVAGRRGRKQQEMRQPPATSPQGGSVATGYSPATKKRLSSSLTRFLRWTAVGGIVHLVISTVFGMWLILTERRPSNLIVMGVMLGCNWLGWILYFYLAHSLKKVWIRDDSLFVSDYLKEIEIHISQVSRISGPDFTMLRRVTLHLHEPSVFGKKIVFAARFFSAGMIARELRGKLYAHVKT